MKRRIALSLALLLSVISMSLMNSDSTVNAQRQRRFSADTGIVSLGHNQLLRVSIAATGDGQVLGNLLRVSFRRMEYAQGDCNSDVVCKQSLATDATSATLTLAPGESASLDLVATTYGRAIILSSSRNVRVTAMIINTATGETVSHIIMANTEGDFH